MVNDLKIQVLPINAQYLWHLGAKEILCNDGVEIVPLYDQVIILMKSTNADEILKKEFPNKVDIIKRNLSKISRRIEGIRGTYGQINALKKNEKYNPDNELRLKLVEEICKTSGYSRFLYKIHNVLILNSSIRSTTIPHNYWNIEQQEIKHIPYEVSQEERGRLERDQILQKKQISQKQKKNP